MHNDLILVLVVITALGFDFTNGFHDTGNAMATSIATGALGPGSRSGSPASSTWSGAFLSFTVAATIASGLVDTTDGDADRRLRRPGRRHHLEPGHLVLGIPSSSSHALIGGVVGSTLAAAGWPRGQVARPGVQGRSSRPSSRRSSPAGRGDRHLSRLPDHPRHDQATRAATASGSARSARPRMVSLAHGTNDAQKTMGIITLALIANGTLPAGRQGAGLGDRLLRPGDQPRHLHRRLAGDPDAGQGPGRDRVAAGHGGGVGLGRDHPAVEPASATRCRPRTWPPARSSAPAWARRAPRSAGTSPGRMATAWVFTLPCAGLVGAAAYEPGPRDRRHRRASSSRSSSSLVLAGGHLPALARQPR